MQTMVQAPRRDGAQTPPGHFSPDGRFFACGISREEICIWENTSTGYVPWSDLRPRLQIEGFSFSPIKISILSWGSGGVQLLHPDNRVNPSPLSRTESHRQSRNHLVACSAGGACIATARQEDSVVTAVDPTRQSLNLNVRIRDIKVVDDTVFVTDWRNCICFRSETVGTVSSVCGTRRETVAIRVIIQWLFSDCLRPRQGRFPS